VRDCNSGFRCVRREAFLRWKMTSHGMEFASEMLVKALKCGSKISHISSGLRCAPVDRTPHLYTWRDGMRHLLYILSQKPSIFEFFGAIAHSCS
jgi:hypothetical protein